MGHFSTTSCIIALMACTITIDRFSNVDATVADEIAQKFTRSNVKTISKDKTFCMEEAPERHIYVSHKLYKDMWIMIDNPIYGGFIEWPVLLCEYSQTRNGPITKIRGWIEGPDGDVILLAYLRNAFTVTGIKVWGD